MSPESDILGALDQLVRTIAPDAVAIREPSGNLVEYELAGEPVLRVWTRPEMSVAVAAIDDAPRRLRSPADVRDPGLAAAIEERVWTLRPIRVPPFIRPGPGPALGTGVAYLSRAPKWQRLGALVIPLWLVAGFAAGSIVERVAGGLAPNATGLAGPVGVLIAVGGWIIALRWLYVRFPPTPAEAAAAFAANRRSTVSLGCLAMGLWFGGAIAVYSAIAGRASDSATNWVVLLPCMGIGLAGSVWTFRLLRRRFPPPPAYSRHARAFVIAVVATVALVVAFFVGMALTPSSVSREQVSWCLGPGSPYVDRAVEVISLRRTWDATTTSTDPNFARACATAWDAAHQTP